MLGCALAIAGGAAQPSSSPTRPTVPSTLALAQPSLSGWSYRLEQATSCSVDDGLAVLKNPTGRSMRVIGLHALVSGVSSSALDASFEVWAVRSGSTPGEVSAVGALTRLGVGHVLPHAIGATFLPVSRSGTWYVVVVTLRLSSAVTHSWTIQGISVRYSQGGRLRDVTFPQHVTLQRRSACTLESAIG
jgi:hypothetical protein